MAADESETLPKEELDRQLDKALEATFPASDAVSVGAPSGTAPDRPLGRRPATLDTQLVDELARHVAATHGEKASANASNVAGGADAPPKDSKA